MNSADREQAKILGQYLKESAKNPTLDHYPEELVRRWIELATLPSRTAPMKGRSGLSRNAEELPSGLCRSGSRVGK